MSNTRGQWSEKNASHISRLEIGSPKDSTSGPVYGLDPCWVKLKESNKLKTHRRGVVLIIPTTGVRQV